MSKLIKSILWPLTLMVHIRFTRNVRLVLLAIITTILVGGVACLGMYMLMGIVAPSIYVFIGMYISICGLVYIGYKAKEMDDNDKTNE